MYKGPSHINEMGTPHFKYVVCLLENLFSVCEKGFNRAARCVGWARECGGAI